MSGTLDLGDGVAVVGAGIGGLVAALSLDAIGVDVTVFEAAPEVRPAGVGINLLPHSIRELDALGLLDRLVGAGHRSDDARVLRQERSGDLELNREASRRATRGRNSRSIVANSTASCSTPTADRIGADRIVLDHRLAQPLRPTTSARAGHVRRPRRNRRSEVAAAAIVAADGIHSAARAQFYPDQGPPKWSGALLWRGIVDRAAGARRSHDDLDRAPGPEVRRLPDRRPRRRSSVVQLHRRAPPRRRHARRSGGLEPRGRPRRLPPRLRGLDVRLARRARH